MLVHWDFGLSLLGAGIFLVLVLAADVGLEDGTVGVIASIPFGVAITTGVLVAYRWTADRMKDDAYGELIRVIDPGESRVFRPHMLVAGLGLLTSLLGIFLLLTRNEFGRTLTTVAYTALVLLTLYCLLGFADLIRLGRRHQRRQALLRGTLEEENRRRRGDKSELGTQPGE